MRAIGAIIVLMFPHTCSISHHFFLHAPFPCFSRQYFYGRRDTCGGIHDALREGISTTKRFLVWEVSSLLWRFLQRFFLILIFFFRKRFGVSLLQQWAFSLLVCGMISMNLTGVHNSFFKLFL